MQQAALRSSLSFIGLPIPKFGVSCSIRICTFRCPAVFSAALSSTSGISSSSFAEIRPAMAAEAVKPYLRVGLRDMSGAVQDDVEVFGKAASGTGSPSDQRGDCPFSQRIYLELEEKSVPYKATYIQEGDDKPDWFMKHNPSGMMPVLRDGEQWIQDSDKIAQYLEEKYPDPPLKTPPEFKNIGEKIFPVFTQYLQSKDPNNSSKNELLKELKTLDEHLQQHGPYIAGDKPTDSDFALIPKLKHLRIALAHYMKFQIPEEFSAVHKYIELLENRPSFKRTDVPEQMIVDGWKKKFGLPDQPMV